MEKLKLLIADGTEDFRLALADALRGAYQVRQCADGCRAKELLASFRPDVLVVDVMLPGLDGISLLQWAAESEIRPMVLATTRLQSDYVMDALDRFGVGYAMMKPCDVRATVARIGDLSTRIHPPAVARPEPASTLPILLRTLNVPTKSRGYTYLREAVPLWMKDPTQSITKELYPAVAARCGCDKSHVERSIRSAIDVAWRNRDESIWRMYFQPDSSGRIPRPTNGDFISRLAQCLQEAEAETV